MKALTVAMLAVLVTYSAAFSLPGASVAKTRFAARCTPTRLQGEPEPSELGSELTEPSDSRAEQSSADPAPANSKLGNALEGTSLPLMLALGATVVFLSLGGPIGNFLEANDLVGNGPVVKMF